ncbi:hypothetical protein V5O48_003075 [Marasmius crinis-equi]|uniref:F-box domain-containing protein n=1 Tax=Marasmius crinis-equi TaxID=585013 RepID=A0ABR3FTW5_9AGAR
MLPTEVFERIIDYCSDEDPQSLRSCSLVCKDWVTRSRQHLFARHLRLDFNNTAAFLDLLHGPRCTVKLFLAALEIDLSSYYEQDGCKTLDKLAQAIADECTSLRSLALHEATSPSVLLPFTNLSLSLTTLCLDGSFWGWGPFVSVRAGKILDLVGNCSGLEVLSMAYDTPGRAIEDAVSPEYQGEAKKLWLPRLRHLDLDVVWNAFIPWFLIPGAVSLPSLGKLELFLAVQPMRMETALLQSFLHLVSSTVVDLVICVMWETIPELDLSSFKALRSVLFRVSSWSSEEVGHHQKIYDIVSTRPTPHNSECPLKVIITDDKMEPPYMEGVHWIADEWYYQDHYQ